MFVDKEVYRFSIKGESGEKSNTQYLLDASNGQQLSPLTKATAIKVAKHYYTGDGEVQEVELITENPPFELSRRRLPAWRVNFDNFGSPSLYISAQSGQLVTKRHEFWRLFDWMFRFHIMDYGEDEDAGNLLLFWIVLFGILACLTGLILTYFRVFKPGKPQINSDKLKTKREPT
jgi:hypothetical protein